MKRRAIVLLPIVALAVTVPGLRAQSPAYELPPALKSMPPAKITPEQRKQLLAFLEALTPEVTAYPRPVALGAVRETTLAAENDAHD